MLNVRFPFPVSRFPLIAADLNGKLEAENGKPETGNENHE
jgi:hypothetical protein